MAEQNPRKYYLELNPPSLADNTADIDRLRRALRQEHGLDRVRVALEKVQPFSAVLRRANWRVTATLARTGQGLELIDLEPGDAAGRPVRARSTPAGDMLALPDLGSAGPAGPGGLGLALDLGTTSLALELIDLSQGQSAARKVLTNPQTSLGADILTRIHQARGEGLKRLQGLVLAGVNRGLEEMLEELGLAAERVTAVAAAGNTTMSHLFLGLDPATICREPYIPLINRLDPTPAGPLGLAVHPRAPVWVLPSVGSYLGGDVVAGLLASGLAGREEVSLFVDVGTNAEVVVGNRDWLMGTAGAAGPALEGGVARMGRPAGPGAVERVRIDPRSLEPEISLIGPGPASGICGSGLIDLVAELFLAGVIDVQGKLVPLEHPRLVETEDGLAFRLIEAGRTASGQPLLFSQVDLDVLLRSKAAMYTILTTLLDQVGLGFADLTAVYVAGAFGQHIDPVQAVRIGLLPDLPPERFISLGNSSLAGAGRVLVSARARAEVEAIQERITYLEMNVNQEFMTRFSAARFLPHTDRSLFPSVPQPLARLEKRRFGPGRR